ncbi:hypothetical protein BpHYR1_038117, partial [Brachionus plicatilis]
TYLKKINLDILREQIFGLENKELKLITILKILIHSIENNYDAILYESDLTHNTHYKKMIKKFSVLLTCILCALLDMFKYLIVHEFYTEVNLNLCCFVTMSFSFEYVLLYPMGLHDVKKIRKIKF